MDVTDKTTAHPLTFEAIQEMDEIRRENHCTEAVCAYPDNCVCWGELQKELSGTNPTTLPWKHSDFDGWSIVGMNHYHINKVRFLFVAMTRHAVH